MWYKLWLILSAIITNLLMLYTLILIFYIIDSYINNENIFLFCLDLINIIVGLIIGYVNNKKLTTILVISLLIVGINFEFILISIYVGFFIKYYNKAS